MEESAAAPALTRGALDETVHKVAEVEPVRGGGGKWMRRVGEESG